MTTLKETLNADLTRHLKARNELETTVLRSVIGAIQTQEKKGKTAVEFDDKKVLALVASEAKTRRATAEEFTKVNVPDRAARETAEADFLAQYLPTPLAEAELVAIVDNVFATQFTEATARDRGAIMKVLVQETQGRADGKTIAALVSARLQ